jgi:protein-disulfide isomerase
VTVIEYFDPNCPHCKDFHQIMKTLVEAHRDDVRFVFKPFPLRRSSLPEIQALYVAHQEGKFSEMLDAQYARQSRSGIGKRDLRDVASEIGMNPDVLLSRIEQGKYRQKILAQRKKAINIGVESTPTVLVNGYFVKTRTPECMNTFIERAKNGTLGGTASK